MSMTYKRAIVAISVLTAACHSDKIAAPAELRTPTCGPASRVSLAPNQAVVLACASGTFINLVGGGKYLVVPQFSSGGYTSGLADSPVAYQIGVAGGTASTGLTADRIAAEAAQPALNAQQRFDRLLRANDRKLSSSAVPNAKVPATAAAVPDLGSLRDFRVLNSSGLSTIGATARLSYSGANVLIYIDTLAPANGFSSAQLQSFGQYFDQTLYGLDVSAFGPPSDIDGNGRVIMLLSPSVNALTSASQCASQGFVAGYFIGSDLVSSGLNSNHGEVFYAVVPDPNGTVSCAHSVTGLLQAVPSTFLHELQHLINFSQHVVLHGGQPEEGWLDEGLSIRAEELGSEYFEAKYPAPSGRTNPSQLFPDSSQGFVSGVLFDSYSFLLRPDTASVTLHTDADDGFSWRGGDWLLVHWLGDVKGKSIYASLEQNRSVGIANIAAAAGESFDTLFGDFSMSLWTDSIVGIPRANVPARDRFQTRNLRQIFQRFFDTSGGSSSVPRAYPVVLTPLGLSAPLNASMAPGTMAFYSLDLSGTNGVTAIRFATPAGQAFAATLHPQVGIYRLPN